MTPEVILGAIVVLPAILLMFLRVNAVLVFLSLCLGDVLTQFVSGDAQSLLTTLQQSNATAQINATDSTIKIALLLFPVVLVTFFMIRTIKGRARLALNLLPAVGVGMLGGLLIVPLLPYSTSQDILNSSLWSQVKHAQNLIVSGSALVCLFVLILQRPKSGGGGDHEEKKGKHKG